MTGCRSWMSRLSRRGGSGFSCLACPQQQWRRGGTCNGCMDIRDSAVHNGVLVRERLDRSHAHKPADKIALSSRDRPWRLYFRSCAVEFPPVPRPCTPSQHRLLPPACLANTCASRRARYTMGGDMGGSDALGGRDRSPTRGETSPTPEAAPAKNGLPVPSNGGGDLLDLEAIFGGGEAPAAAPVGPGAAAATPAAAVNGTAGADLLADVFGASGGLAPSRVGGAAPAPVTPAVVPAVAAVAPAAQDGDFGGFEVAPSREEKVVVSGGMGRWSGSVVCGARFRLRCASPGLWRRAVLSCGGGFLAGVA